MKLVLNNDNLYLVPNNESVVERGIPIEIVPDKVYGIDIEKVLETSRLDLQRKAVSTKSMLNERIIKDTIISYFIQALNEKYEQSVL